MDYRAAVVAGRPECPPGIVGELENAKGMSVFEIKKEGDVLRIAAALTLVRRIRDFHGTIIPFDVVKRSGFTLTHSPKNAFIFDSSIRDNHYDITKSRKSKTDRFAEQIAKSWNEVTFTSRQIVDYVNDEMRAGRLLRNDVFRDAPSVDTKSIMIGHWKNIHLQLSHG